MKFVTSRIISPKEVRSLREIVEDEQKKNNTKTAYSSQEKITKKASAETPTVKNKKSVASKEVKSKNQNPTKNASKEKKEAKSKNQTLTKNISKKKKEVKSKKEKNYKVTDVKASKEMPSNKLGIVWKSLKSEASLSNEERNFLLEYFKRYYPADYAEAMIASY